MSTAIEQFRSALTSPAGALKGTEEAANVLVGLSRVRTPLGASEFLRMQLPVNFDRYRRLLGSDDFFRARCEVALEVSELYKAMFPREYAASQSPVYSVAREHEFYRLVAMRCFRVEVEPIKHQPDFFWPAIPVTSLQRHKWDEGCCEFKDLELVFKLILVLSGRRSVGWRELTVQYGLAGTPAPPLEHAAWHDFVNVCLLEDSPLFHLPLAFYMVGLQTGNVWLDVPAEGFMGLKWDARNIAKLMVERIAAEKMLQQVYEINSWLEMKPRERIQEVLAMWNAAECNAKLLSNPEGE